MYQKEKRPVLTNRLTTIICILYTILLYDNEIHVIIMNTFSRKTNINTNTNTNI